MSVECFSSACSEKENTPHRNWKLEGTDRRAVAPDSPQRHIYCYTAEPKNYLKKDEKVSHEICLKG
jgi:hypothetical protein